MRPTTERCDTSAQHLSYNFPYILDTSHGMKGHKYDMNVNLNKDKNALCSDPVGESRGQYEKKEKRFGRTLDLPVCAVGGKQLTKAVCIICSIEMFLIPTLTLTISFSISL